PERLSVVAFGRSWDASMCVYNDHMPISARNKLRGKIEEIQLGDIMAHVVVRVGDNLIESAITRRSADELKLRKGDTVTAVVKATEVMIQKDCLTFVNSIQGRSLLVHSPRPDTGRRISRGMVQGIKPFLPL